jgi:hypothetical protein
MIIKTNMMVRFSIPDSIIKMQADMLATMAPGDLAILSSAPSTRILEL